MITGHRTVPSLPYLHSSIYSSCLQLRGLQQSTDSILQQLFSRLINNNLNRNTTRNDIYLIVVSRLLESFIIIIIYLYLLLYYCTTTSSKLFNIPRICILQERPSHQSTYLPRPTLLNKKYDRCNVRIQIYSRSLKCICIYCLYSFYLYSFRIFFWNSITFYFLIILTCITEYDGWMWVGLYFNWLFLFLFLFLFNIKK